MCRTYDDDEDDLIAKAFHCALKMNAIIKTIIKIAEDRAHTRAKIVVNLQKRDRVIMMKCLALVTQTVLEVVTVLMIQLLPKIGLATDGIQTKI